MDIDAALRALTLKREALTRKIDAIDEAIVVLEELETTPPAEVNLAPTQISGAEVRRLLVPSETPGPITRKRKPKGKRGSWTAKDDALLRKLAKEGKPDYTIAVSLRRSTAGVQARRKRLGIAKRSRRK
jgi:hypothetical protein